MTKIDTYADIAYYHITTDDKWQQIRKDGGIKSYKKKVFVSTIGELSVLSAIAVLQLPEIYTDANEIFILRFLQSKNDFKSDEIIPDNQSDATTEWTQPFQKIIRREFISIENIDLVMTIKLGGDSIKDGIIQALSQITDFGKNNYNSSSL